MEAAFFYFFKKKKTFTSGSKLLIKVLQGTGLFHCDRFSQVSRLINVGTSHNSDMIR